MRNVLHTFTLCFNSKGNSNAQIHDSSTLYPQTGQHITIATFRELNQALTSRRISRRRVNTPTGENFRSTDDLQEEDNNLQTTLTPQQLTQEVSRRLLGSLRN
uniref:C4 n=1 Tax=Turnip leaf roll virus TaxID=1766828 RepID=A0A0S3JNU8_9GEMI|nr:C4 [Turnip leaf roll virus]